MRELLSYKHTWNWEPTQKKAFAKVKAETKPYTLLAMYDPKADAKISADTFSHDLGAMLLQKTKQILVFL